MNLGWNIARALARFVPRPKFVSRATFAARLRVCQPCDHRRGGKCTACGCWINLKARLRAKDCDNGYWPPRENTK